MQEDPQRYSYRTRDRVDDSLIAAGIGTYRGQQLTAMSRPRHVPSQRKQQCKNRQPNRELLNRQHQVWCKIC